MSTTTETTISELLRAQMIQTATALYVKYLIGETPPLPHDPIALYTAEDICAMSDSKSRIFFSYFTSPDIPLVAHLEEDPRTELDFLLVGLYHRKNGMDEQLAKLLDRVPEMFVFTLSDYVVALYAPHLPSNDYQQLTFTPGEEGYPFIIILDGEPRDCLSLAQELHHSPFLRDITNHIGNHACQIKHHLEKLREQMWGPEDNEEEDI